MKLVLSALLSLASASAVMAAEATTRIDVTGLTCPSCSYIVATALKRVDSVEIIEFTEGQSEDGTYLLRFDDSLTSPEALVAAVTDVGYGASLAAPETGAESGS